MFNIRWKQRFDNFEKALLKLKEAIDTGINNMSLLEKEGTIQRFEYTLELGWKTLKDYLEFNNIILKEITPRSVIKEAFSAKIIVNANIWIEMPEYRNLLSHTYNNEVFEEAVEAIFNSYYNEINTLYSLFKDKLADE